MDKIDPESAEREIAEKMCSTNYEQFKSLVRMHLSFELDLNTDEFDLPCHEVIYYEKGKLKKWDRLSKKIKGCTTGTKTSSPFEANTLTLNEDLIRQLRVLKEYLLQKDNVIQEGIFRRTGAVSRQNELRSLLNQRKALTLPGYTVHDCATVYKGCLSDLPEPLLTDAHYPAHCQIAELCNNDDKHASKGKDERLLHSVQLLLLLLPKDNRTLLEDVIVMLHVTAQHEKLNKMNADTLATLFAPHLICPRNLPPEALHYVSQNMSSVISYMIVKGSAIFDIPLKLATDIRAYSLEQKRKKTMSPEQVLDESISDVSTVNTVYTFVDREKTAEAHNSNPTDTALAQLYAHIQSMPESSKKRKLINKFNKENGQGTPLQFLMLNRLKNTGSGRSAKSIGDSIKKHIFHKTIMSRTPKQINLKPQCDTPNSAFSAPKIRILFQSPKSNSSNSVSNQAIKRHPLRKSVSSSSLLTASVANKTSDKLFTSPETPQRDCTIVCRKDASPADEENPEPKSSCNGETTASEEDKTLEKMLTPERRNFSSKVRSAFFRYKSESDVSVIDARGIKQESNKSVSLNDLNLYTLNEKSSDPRLEEASADLCNPTMDDDAENAITSSDGENMHTPNRLNIYRPKDLITSTPSISLGRRSMSPITKSTQRMPKSMQESIMTPRSRKPVMLAATIGLLDQNQATYPGDLSSFREQDEDSFLSQNTSMQVEHPTMYRSFSESDLLNDDRPINSQLPPDSLTNTFREYLLSRSVLTTSPVDASFSSHSDDFGSTPDIRDLDESEMSTSLLYCLNGNRPEIDELSDSIAENRSESNQMQIESTNCSNNRKRASDTSTDNLLDEKENNDPRRDGGFASIQTKKLFVLDKNPNETSL